MMLPILDIGQYLSNRSGSNADQFIHELRETCHGSGFFYLIGHGVEARLEKRVLDVANRFFDLPLEERESIAIANSPHFRGYTLLEQEMTAGKYDWRDQIDIGPEEPEPKLTNADPAWMRLRGPNQWPENLPAMSEIMTSWMDQVKPIGMALMQALARGLGQSVNYFDDRMTPDPYTRVKIIRYPASRKMEVAGRVSACIMIPES